MYYHNAEDFTFSINNLPRSLPDGGVSSNIKALPHVPKINPLSSLPYTTTFNKRINMKTFVNLIHFQMILITIV